MTKKILIHAIWAASVLSGGVCAQTLQDKIYFSYGLLPATSLKEGVGESRLAHQYELQVGPPPIRLIPRLQWIHTFYGRVAEYNFNNLDSEVATASSVLYDIQYGTIYIYDFKNPKWSLFASPRILFRSDLENLFTGNSLFFSGIALANYNPDGNDRLVWSFGFAFANDFNRNVLIPIAGFTYTDKRYTIEVAYPRVNFLYKPTSHIEWGATASIIGGIYRTNEVTLRSQQTAPYTRTINVQLGHTFNYLLTSKVVLNSCIGYAFVRNYDLMNSDFKSIQSINLDLKGSFFLRTGISVRL